MKFKPTQDRILVRVVEPEKPAVWAPDNSAPKPTYGLVVAIGPGSRFSNGETLPVCVKVGDRVMYEKSRGELLLIEGESLLEIREGDVKGVFEDTEEAAVTKLHSV